MKRKIAIIILIAVVLTLVSCTSETKKATQILEKNGYKVTIYNESDHKVNFTNEELTQIYGLDKKHANITHIIYGKKLIDNSLLHSPYEEVYIFFLKDTKSAKQVKEIYQEKEVYTEVVAKGDRVIAGTTKAVALLK